MTEIARVRTVLGGFSGAPGVMTMFFRKNTSLPWSNVASYMVARVQGAWEDIGDNLNNTMTVATSGDIDVILDTTGEIQDTLTTDGASQNGSSAFGYGPLASGVAVTWRTTGIVAGKHVRGRTFIVPVRTGISASDGTVTNDALALFNTFAQTMEGTGSEHWRPVVWSRPKKEKVTHEYLRYGSSHDITGHQIKSKYAILRSRRD